VVFDERHAVRGEHLDQALLRRIGHRRIIEAAQIALDVAPGLGRGFAFERLKVFDEAAFGAVRRGAEGRRKPAGKLPIWGSDHDPDQVRRSFVNLRAAGLADCVTVDEADLLVRAAPAGEGVLVANPPYGVRIGEAEELAAFYPRLGDALKARWAGWCCYVLSADPQLPKLIGLKASRRTPLFNGALECRLFEYRMQAGSMRRAKPEA